MSNEELELATLERENKCSVSLKRGAKGDTSFEVKVYDENEEKASERAQHVYDHLCIKYPE